MRPILWSICLLVLTAFSAGESGSRADAPKADKPDPKVLLEQVVRDVMTNPDLKSLRDCYGTPGDNRVALCKESPVLWPADWRPKVPGCRVSFASQTTPLWDFVRDYMPGGDQMIYFLHHRQPRLLGLRLDKMNLQPNRSYNDQICVCLFNIGGDGGEDEAFGGCTVYYTIKQEHGEWRVELEGYFSP